MFSLSTKLDTTTVEEEEEELVVVELLVFVVVVEGGDEIATVSVDDEDEGPLLKDVDGVVDGEAVRGTAVGWTENVLVGAIVLVVEGELDDAVGERVGDVVDGREDGETVSVSSDLVRFDALYWYDME